MFEYYENILCVEARWLYEDAKVMTYGNYHKLVQRGKIKRMTTGGNGRKALVIYESIPHRFKVAIEKIADPYESVKHIIFADHITHDAAAYEFYKAYRLEDGSELPENKQTEYLHQAMIFNAAHHIATNVVVQRSFGGKRGMWDRMLTAIQNLPTSYQHTRYKNVNSFRRAYKKYQDEGYAAIVSGKFLNNNSAIITGEVAEWLLATYCLPIKYTVPEMLDIYEEIREDKGWKPVTERAVNAWLDKSEQKRIWYIARHGRAEYNKKFGHTLMREKSTLFPNAWWVIDGTKLDLIHYADNKQKMGAQLKINLVFDVYSEKIIGWDLAFSENHVSHFKAVKMAVSTAECKPFTFTYDNQSGHKSARMQELYSRLVATGGTHFPHKSGRNSSPAEQMIGRFQQQQISKMWFSDKQSIKVRKADNQPNVDFIAEYKEGLPTMDELHRVVAVLVDRWNCSKKRKDVFTRNEKYNEEALKREEIEYLDQIALFWIEETQPKKYYKNGMPLTVMGKDYIYEVYDQDGNVDMEFRRKYVDEKLIVRYDPEFLDEVVELYEVASTGEKRFVAHATPKRAHESIPMLQTEEGRKWLKKDMKVRELEAERDWQAYLELERRTGISRESLILDQELAVKLHGQMTKVEREISESLSHTEKY